MAVTINGTTGVQLDDNDKQQFGTGDDLSIFHDGSHSNIKHDGTGDLKIDSDVIKIRATNNEAYIKCQNDAVELYYNDNKKLETYTSGITVQGHIKANQDDSQLILGAGNDFKIYHDGTHSYVKNTGGNLVLQGNGTNSIVIQSVVGENAIVCNANNNVELYHDNSLRFKTDSGWCYTYGDSSPANDNVYNLGGSSKRWDNVHASNGTIQTSDRNEKNTIVDTDLGLSFVNKLKPVSYKFNGKTRTHYGLIAQDVETTLSDISKSTTNFAGFIKEDIPDQLYVEEDEIPEGKKVGDVRKSAYTTYGLRYSEFISPLIKAVQELSAEVETLKTEKTKLQTDLTALTARVAALEAA